MSKEKMTVNGLIAWLKKAPAYDEAMAMIKTCKHCGCDYNFELYLRSYPNSHRDIQNCQPVRLVRIFLRSNTCMLNHYKVKSRVKYKPLSRNFKHGHCIHGPEGIIISPTYTSWVAAKQRCYNKNSKLYKNYGGLGVTVCKRWKNSFANFLKDMGEQPSGYCLKIINKKLPYSKRNCKWATHQEISDNRDMPIVKYNLSGEEVTIKQVADRYHLRKNLAACRLYQGWSKESFERGKNVVTLNNRTKLLKKLFESHKEVLTLKEIEFISLRIGIDSTTPRTLQEVADIKGLTRQRVAQILDMAVFKMMKSVNDSN